MRILGIALIVAMLMPASGVADQNTTNVTLTDTSPPSCKLPNAPVISGTASFSGPATATHSTVNLGILTDQSTGSIKAQNFSLTFRDAFCNSKGYITLRSINGGLTLGNEMNPAQPPAGFLNRVIYMASARWGQEVTGTLTASSSSSNSISQSFDAPERGDLFVSVTIPGSDATQPLMAGQYMDLLIIELGTSL